MRRRSAIGSPPRDILAVDRDTAGVGLDQPVGEPQQRGLAGAGAADDGEEFALRDVERDIVDRKQPPCAAPPSKLLRNMGEGDRRRSGMNHATSGSIFTLEEEAGEHACLARRRPSLNFPRQALKHPSEMGEAWC